MICWFFGAAILGDISDTIGRRKALLICLIGAFFGYFLSAIAIIVKSLGLLIFGRVIAGFTSGSQPIAQAAIVDVSSPVHKARNIGLILLAVSLGFVFGPIIGGVLSDSNIVSWFSFSTPFYFASFISLFNAFLLWMTFKETFMKTKKVNINLAHAFWIFKSAFTHEKIRLLSVIMLIMIFGWSSYFTFISVYVLQVYHFTPLQNSLFLAVMGLGFSLGCGYLVDFCAKRYTNKNTVIVNLFLTAIFVLILIFVKQQLVSWVCNFIVGTTIAIAYSTIIAMFSNQVTDTEQGWVMGVTGSIMALCFGLTAFLTGYFVKFGADFPMLLSFAGLTISGFIMFFFNNNSAVISSEPETG